MITVNREELLSVLSSVAAGLSTREIVQQSSCFVFKGGWVYTYNEDIACQCEVPITFTGAVRAQQLLNILGKLSEETLDVESTEEGQFLFKGKRRRFGVLRDAEIALPIDKIERPETWKKLDPAFMEGINLVKECAGTDEARFVTTCINVTPEFVEGYDNHQLMRFFVKTKFKKPILLKAYVMGKICQLGMTEYHETEAWVHFRNPKGIIISARRHVDNDPPYPNLDEIYQQKGHKIDLPRGLGEAAERAAVFAEDTAGDVEITVRLLTEGKIRVRGQGLSGYFTEVKSIAYDGPNQEFMIRPLTLIEITKKHTEAEINERTLKVTGAGGRWVYLTALGSAEENSETAPEAPAEEKPKKKKVAAE